MVITFCVTNSYRYFTEHLVSGQTEIFDYTVDSWIRDSKSFNGHAKKCVLE